MDNLSVNNLRILSLNQIERANSGHPGVALSAAPVFYSLYANIMDYDVRHPKNMFRDRFVVSAGHASALLYSTLHTFGFNISRTALENFRQVGSITPGHPEVNTEHGIDSSTGPLGQGVANAVGMAIAAKHYGAVFNKPDIQLFSNKIFCFVGDGCLMEGISYEATSLAGNLKLDNLVLIYDKNRRTMDGSIDITWTEDVEMRFKAIGFDVLEVKDGNDVGEITKVLLTAKQNSTRPTLVIVNTLLGFGSEFQDDSVVHGKPLTKQQIESVKKNFNIEVGGFEVLPDVKAHAKKQASLRGRGIAEKQRLLKIYEQKYPEDYRKLMDFTDYSYSEKAIEDIKNFRVDRSLRTLRDVNHEIFNCFHMENLMGGSADVECSTKMYNKKDNHFSASNYKGTNVHFGIREHAMAGISNGIALFCGIISHCNCFLAFSDYLKPSLRLSAMMKLPVLYVFTHDSILIGEDGPTHQPVEQIAGLRAIPDFNVFRPYNDSEIKAAYITFLTTMKAMAMIISKNAKEFISTDLQDCLKGGYVISTEKERLDAILIATGVEVDLALKVKELLAEREIDIRVVSMPCVEIFDSQPDDYKNSVLPKNTKILTLEAGSGLGLIKFVHNGVAFSVDSFGTSGKAQDVAEKYGFSEEKIAKKIAEKIKK